ncbi:unnamed protein product [Sphagnum balticum]
MALFTTWQVRHPNIWKVDICRIFPANSLTSHPGGPEVILIYAGQDATDDEYDPIHPSGVIEEHLPVDTYLGEVDPATVSKAAVRAVTTKDVPNENAL